MRIFFFLGSLNFFVGLFAQNAEQFFFPCNGYKEQWLTGTLLTPFEEAIPKGSYVFDFYFYNTADIGEYNSHWHTISSRNYYSLIPSIYFFYGITDRLTLSFFPAVQYTTTDGTSGFGFQDLPCALSYQILQRNTWDYFPGILLSIMETFPAGKYKNLNPHKLYTDQTGDGSFITTFVLTFYDVYCLGGQYFAPYIDIEYDLWSNISVTGYNTYGGGYGTHGKLSGGDNLDFYFGFEYSFTRHFVLSFDFEYTHKNRLSFSGKQTAFTGRASSEQFSIAPAIEYDFNEYFGINTGLWFTLAGRNTPQFVSGIVNFSSFF